MDPITMMLIAQAGAGAYQLIKGSAQMANNKRPEYQIPDEIKSNLTMAQQQALEGLPEEQRKIFIENIQRSSANAISQAQDRRSGLVGLTGIAQSESDAYRNLLAMDVAARQENQAKVVAANKDMAAYKDQAFEANQMEPYRFKQNQASAMVGSGMQNLFGAAHGAVIRDIYKPKAVPTEVQAPQVRQAPAAMEYESRYATPLIAPQAQQQVPLMQNFYQSNQQMPQNPNNTYQAPNQEIYNPWANLSSYTTINQ
jgi:hypothetical protein